VKKLLESAIANGENNLGFDKNNMYVSEATVSAGPTLNRWMPKAFGRAGKILKRTSQIEIVLEERIPGKGRKTKEQMEEEKKKRLEEKRKESKAREKAEQTEKKEEVKPEAKTYEKGAVEGEKAKDDKKKNWKSRIFRRKSM
jgi:chromatin remodeling complex protein RSC6